MKIRNFIKKELNEDVIDFRYLSDHGASEVYFILTDKGRYILRRTKNEYPLSNNFVSLKFLEKTGIVPKPILLKKVGDYYFSLEEFLDGEKVDFRENKDKKLILNLVKSLKIIHKIKNKNCGYSSTAKSKNWKNFLRKEFIVSYKNKFLRRLPDKSYLNIALENMPNTNKFVLLHGDFSFTNSLFYKEEVFLFDFEESMFGEKEFDLGLIYYMELFENKFLDELVNSSGYNREKIIYYAFLIGIRKVANSPKQKLDERIKKIKKLKEVINKKW